MIASGQFARLGLSYSLPRTGRKGVPKKEKGFQGRFDRIHRRDVTERNKELIIGNCSERVGVRELVPGNWF